MGRLNGLLDPVNRYRLFWSLILLERIIGCLAYNLRFTDSDQTIMWNMAMELMDGQFHSFTFYGQSYNIALEVFLAIPFLKLGFSYPLSFAIVTSSLAVLPYGVLSFLFRKKSGELAGIVPLLALILMPPEFLMLSSISRGFVQGIALSSMALYFWAGNAQKMGAIIAGFLLPLTVLCNPNCILFLPIFLLFFQADLKRIFIALGGVFVSLPLVIWHIEWYKIHPEKIIHPAPSTDFSIEYFWIVVKHLDNYFNYITPVFWRAAWLLLPLFYVLLFFLYRKSEWPGKIAAIAWAIGIVAAFFMYKTTDATSSIYYSGARMFLAWPLILIVVFLKTIHYSPKEKWVRLLVFVVIGFTLVKSAFFPFFIRRHHRQHTETVVHIIPPKDLRYQCLVVKSIADITKADLIEAVTGFTPNQPIAYGCPCLIPDFPLTYIRGYERKTWLKPLREKATREINFCVTDQDLLKLNGPITTWRTTEPVYHFTFKITNTRMPDVN